MKRLIVLATLIALSAPAFAGYWSGWDSNGNWTHGYQDQNGWSGWDGNGNWIHGSYGHDAFGNGFYSGWDGRGNWIHGNFGH
jgi:hypothetical protein